MARVLKVFHSITCTPTRSSAIGMSHTCLCFPSHSWHSFTEHGGMEGRVDLHADAKCIAQSTMSVMALKELTTVYCSCKFPLTVLQAKSPGSVGREEVQQGVATPSADGLATRPPQHGTTMRRSSPIRRTLAGDESVT